VDLRDIDTSTHSDDLLGDQARHQEDVIALPADTKEEGDGVEGIAKDGLKGKEGTVDVEVTADPGEEPVDETDEGDDAQQCSDDTAGDPKTEHGAVRKRVESVLVLLLRFGDDGPTGGKRLLGLGVPQLGDGKRGGDGHDAG
jgi:hypothetical protein